MTNLKQSLTNERLSCLRAVLCTRLPAAPAAPQHCDLVYFFGLGCSRLPRLNSGLWPLEPPAKLFDVVAVLGTFHEVLMLGRGQMLSDSKVTVR